MSYAFAFDRVRRFDLDGRLHVDVSNISKACVSEYRGTEIPGGVGLGLAPGRVYRLLRDPGELERAVPSFNNLPILSEHLPVNAFNPRPELVVGATGSDAVFEFPYLRNSLVVWTQEAIEAIESGEAQEISSGYRFRVDLTPGVFMGEKYDGVMRDILGSHIALVPDGRVGPDCVVADARLFERPRRVVALFGRGKRNG